MNVPVFSSQKLDALSDNDKFQYLLNIACAPETRPGYVVQFEDTLSEKTFNEIACYINGKSLDKNQEIVLEAQVSRHLRICLNGANAGVYFLKKHPVDKMSFSNFLSTYNNYTFFQEKKNGEDDEGNPIIKKTKVPFGKFCSHFEYDTLHLEDVVWKPHHGIPFECYPGEKVLNLFPGFVAERLSEDEIRHSVIYRIQNHIRILCGHDEEVYEQFWMWLCHIVQKPWVKSQAMPIVLGRQGCGKSVFIEFLVNHVFGNDIAVSLDKLSRITDNFNSILLHRVFTAVSETESLGFKAKQKEIDTLKARITDSRFQATKKGKDTTDERCYNNFILLTNHRDCVSLTDDSRRELVFEASDELCGNTEYFEKLVKEVFNKKGGSMLYTYILNLPEVDVSRMRKIVKTSLRQEIVALNKDAVEIFFEERVPQIKPDYSCPTPGLSRFVASRLYDNYTQWCDEVKEYALSFRKFLTAITATHKRNERGTKQRDGKNTFTCIDLFIEKSEEDE